MAQIRGYQCHGRTRGAEDSRNGPRENEPVNEESLPLGARFTRTQTRNNRERMLGQTPAFVLSACGFAASSALVNEAVA